MNTVVTSKEEILKASRELIQQQGCPAVNIRSVAAVCGISVGSIYNYFGSKAELVGAAVESVWHEIFHRPEEGMMFPDTLSCICWLYQRMEYGCKQYPGFFSLHSLHFLQEEKEDGKRQMQKTWQHISNNLCFVIKHDPNLREDAFNQEFTVEKFADMLFSLFLSAIFRQDFNPGTVLEMVRRTLYA